MGCIIAIILAVGLGIYFERDDVSQKLKDSYRAGYAQGRRDTVVKYIRQGIKQHGLQVPQRAEGNPAPQESPREGGQLDERQVEGAVAVDE